jgi:hypothetical protein
MEAIENIDAPVETAVQDIADQTPETAQPAPAVALPVCPHCSDDPAKLSIMTQIFPGGAIGSIFFCGNPSCRKIVSVQLVGMQKAPGGK